jgi:16S rRNA (cytosine1402-N4)-methyltransferase
MTAYDTIFVAPAAAPVGHKPVLLKEVLNYFAPKDGARYLDCTFGGGGHTKALLDSANQVSVVALDRDPDAQARAAELSRKYEDRFQLVDLNFGDLGSLPQRNFDGILFDLGVSSFQLDNRERGFSFRSDAPADMRMDPRCGVSASQWLETATESMLVLAIRDYGEEKQWKRVIRAIIAARGTGALARTSSLADIISNAIPERERRVARLHPATRSFQGIRIAVNDELGALEKALPQAFDRLGSGGILCVISFHSLEDRVVKRAMRRWCGMPESDEDSMPQDLRIRKAEALTKRPDIPTDLEIETNARSRSAKLRAIRKL